MKIKDLISTLEKHDGEREVVLHDWTEKKGTEFYSLVPSCTPNANTKNLFVLITTSIKEPIRQ